MSTTIRAIGTAVPPHYGTQTQVARWATNVLDASCGDDPQAQRTRRTARGAIERIYGRSGIATRHSVVPDYAGEPEDFALYPANWRLEPQPTTATRMELYRRTAPPLACRAAERCLAGAEGLARDAITHLIVVSCTGFFAPGLDAHLTAALGLRADVQRLTIGFMGCHAAFNALRAADAICRAQPEAHVLIVCVELCTIHFQRDPTLADIVANSLFSDGAAAFVVAPRPATGSLELVDSTSRLDASSEDQMTWTITDTGFRMMLGSEVPHTLKERVEPFVDELLGRAGRRRADVGFWAIHPGGRRIVEVVRDRLGLSDDEAAPSFEVLAEHGNMSSPTIAFVLERVLQRRPAPGTLGVALAFGPGLTLESALLRVA